MKKTILASILLAAVTTIPGFTFASITADLQQGSTGTPVVTLQSYLGIKGFLTVAPTGYFGSLTQQAVENYQTSVGLPSTGYVGPLTRAKINAELIDAPTPGTSQAANFVTTLSLASTTTSVTQGTSNSNNGCPQGYTCAVSTIVPPLNPTEANTTQSNITTNTSSSDIIETDTETVIPQQVVIPEQVTTNTNVTATLTLSAYGQQTPVISSVIDSNQSFYFPENKGVPSDRVILSGSNIPSSFRIIDTNNPSYQTQYGIPVGDVTANSIDVYIPRSTADHVYNLEIQYLDPFGVLRQSNAASVSLRAYPSATFTINGSHALTINQGNFAEYSWNGGSDSDSYSLNVVPNASRCTSPTIAVNASTTVGTTDIHIPYGLSQCVYTMTYTAHQNSTGFSASDVVTMTVQ